MPGNEDLSLSSVSALNFQKVKIHLGGRIIFYSSWCPEQNEGSGEHRGRQEGLIPDLRENPSFPEPLSFSSITHTVFGMRGSPRQELCLSR